MYVCVCVCVCTCVCVNVRHAIYVCVCMIHILMTYTIWVIRINVNVGYIIYHNTDYTFPILCIYIYNGCHIILIQIINTRFVFNFIYCWNSIHCSVVLSEPSATCGLCSSSSWLAPVYVSAWLVCTGCRVPWWCV